MAEQTVNSVTSTLIGELTNRVLSGLIKRFGKQTGIGEKLQRLEMLLIKIHSAVEASEKRTIKNLRLIQWRDKLKEATSQGDEVLASFRRQAEDVEATSSANAIQQQGEESSSPGAASATAKGALSFRRNSLFSMVQGVRNVSKVLFSGDEDMEKLNSTLDRLEKLSPDIGEFIRLLQLEAPLLCCPDSRTSRRTWKTPTKLGAMKKRKLAPEMQRSPTNSKPLSPDRLFGLLRNDEKIEEMSAQCIKEKGDEKLDYITKLTACDSEEEPIKNFVTRLSAVSQKEPKGMLSEEQTVESVASALTGELTNRVFSGLIQRFSKQTDGEKLQQLEMLLIKIHSVVEASEKRTIKNLWLLQWRDKLKEAISQGDEVLASFRRHAEDAEATSSDYANQQQGEASSSPGAASATATGALSFTRNSLFGMVQGICNATQVLLSGDEDMEKLNSTLVRFEKLSLDIGEFIRLLELEVPLPKVDQIPTAHGATKEMTKMRESYKRIKRSAKLVLKMKRRSVEHSKPASPGCSLFGFSLPNDGKEEMSAQCIEEEKQVRPRPESRSSTGFAKEFSKEIHRKQLKSSRNQEKFPCSKRGQNVFAKYYSEVSQKERKGTLRLKKIEEMPEEVLLVCAKEMSVVIEREQQGTHLQDRLEAAFREICNAIEQTGSREIGDLEWLACWAGILREAKEQGCAILVLSARARPSTRG